MPAKAFYTLNKLKNTKYAALRNSVGQNTGTKDEKIEVKVKVNFALEQAMKAQRVSRVIALLFL
jgi:hypothetical protein